MSHGDMVTRSGSLGISTCFRDATNVVSQCLSSACVHVHFVGSSYWLLSFRCMITDSFLPTGFYSLSRCLGSPPCPWPCQCVTELHQFDLVVPSGLCIPLHLTSLLGLSQTFICSHPSKQFSEFRAIMGSYGEYLLLETSMYWSVRKCGHLT